jgi:hypothetical protein
VREADQPIGTCGQALGRGLVPRLSSGTLQLSIRCSSFHFRPRRSFPVSVAGEVAEFDAGSPRRTFCWATVGSVKQIASTAPSVPTYDDRMVASQFWFVLTANICAPD